MYSVYFIKKTEQSETILRNSAVRYSIFCGSLFKSDSAIETIDCFRNTTFFGVIGNFGNRICLEFGASDLEFSIDGQ